MKDKQTVKFNVTKDEFMQISDNAIACNRKLSGYLREVALNMCVLEPDSSCVEKHTAEISAYRNVIQQLVFTIKKSGNYTPADLEYILEYTREILKIEKKFVEFYITNVLNG